MDVKDRVIIITGGASGIGAALGRLFVEEGAAHVALADLDRPGAEAVAHEIGDRASAHGLDVTDAAAVKALVDTVEANHGPVGLYVSNAGILVADTPDFTIFSASDADWRKSWDVNVHAHLHACRAVLPGMLARGEGGFLITASAAGLLSQIGASAYSATKHAAVGFAESLAITHGDDGIYVAALCPQAVESKMSAGAEDSSAALDGVMPGPEMARRTLDQMREGRFMIRPHEQVEQYFQAKAADYDRWVGAMRKLRRKQMERTGRPI
ncbi:SDR family oxidoreductase [Yunchengibacter salinarum]|uniref:SDR family oxidoreductase n=1 Tax=Yunchengibacter salinarum TaxID=3133399 RepID=UPI0035B5C779